MRKRKKLEDLTKKTKGSTHYKKRVFLEELEKYHGIIKNACEAARIHRNTYYNWRKADQSFCNQADEILDEAIDFVETKLYDNINKGKETSIIFYLKTKAAHRGYYEKTQMQLNSINAENITFHFGNSSDEQKKLNE